MKVSTKKEAEKELAKFLVEVEAGEYIAPEKMTLKDFAENQWLKKYAEKKLSASTQKHYIYQLKSHILPVFGHMRLDQIKTMHLIDFFNDLDKPDIRKDGKEGMLPAPLSILSLKC